MPLHQHERKGRHIVHRHIVHKEAKRCALCHCDMGEATHRRRPSALRRGITISQNVIPLCPACQVIAVNLERFVAKRYSELEKRGVHPLHMIVAGVALVAAPEPVSTVVGVTFITAGIHKMRKLKKGSRVPRLVFEDHLQLAINKALTDGEARGIIRRWIELRYPLLGSSVDFQVRYQSLAA